MSLKIRFGPKKSKTLVVEKINSKGEIETDVKKISIIGDSSGLSETLTFLSKLPKGSIVETARNLRFTHLIKNVPIWEYSNWKTKAGTDVKHKDLWKKVFKRILEKDIEITNLDNPKISIKSLIIRAFAMAKSFSELEYFDTIVDELE